MAQQHTTTNTNWSKVFWIGALIAIPLAAGVANVLAFILIDQEYPESNVADTYYKQGLGVNQVVDHDKKAAMLRVGADVEINCITGIIDVALSGDMPLPGTLTLSFMHPTDARQDYSLLLRRKLDGRYLGRIGDRLRHRWYIELSPSGVAGKPDWRIRGVVDVDSDSRSLTIQL